MPIIKTYRVKATKSASIPFVRAWHLDQPRNNQRSEVIEEVSGWVFTEGQTGPLLVELHVDGERVQSCPPNIPVPKARRSVFGADDPSPNDITAGFSIGVPASATLIKLVFVYEDQSVTAAEIKASNTFKVQEGLGGYLFLDNDTNKSVDQFTGRITLGTQAREGWEKFFEGLRHLEADGAIAKLMICPAKEEVFSDLYPHKRGVSTPVDNVVDLAGPGQLVDHFGALSAEREAAFSKIDTHWSDYGARIGAAVYLQSVGLASFASHLPTSFKDHRRFGDLGGKLTPQQSGTFLVLDPAEHVPPSYSNGIDNHGRIWVYDSTQAPVAETLVLFGDSYSVSLSAILARVFKRVVYVYSAASTNRTVLDHEKPKYVLCQTNQRFVTGAPLVNEDLEAKLSRKLQTVGSIDQPTAAGKNAFYAKLMQHLARNATA
ncbi:hypothetical protein [Roseivivax marinus]|uniref:hypothetical protein n=1 Tax=Roseivivax marinus TaxID=1379903 RepID=UPI00273E31A9|nr:hypothetical protein [Roseivivax marinus]